MKSRVSGLFGISDGLEVPKDSITLFGGKETDNDGKLPIYHKQTHKQTVQANKLIWAFMLIVEVLIYGSYSILVNLSKEDGKLPYNTSVVVLFIEAIKLVCSLVMYIPVIMSQNFSVPRVSVLTCASFGIPAVLYTLNNNIGLHMQTQMDPTTYQVLSNLKIATTGLLYRIIVKRKLSNYQWLAMGLLMSAGLCDSYGGFHSNVPNTENIFITVKGLVMMAAYLSISSLAAVYTEYIMKKQFEVSLHVQNTMLYTYGVALSFMSSWWITDVSHDRSDGQSHGFLAGFSSYTWILIFVQVSNGLIMSVVIKHGSSITRLFIISGGMLTATLMSVFILGTVINLAFLLAAVLVITAIYLYHL